MTARPQHIHPFGMNEAEAAHYASLSVNFFRRKIRDGLLPKPRRLDSRLIWLRDELEIALRNLPLDGEDEVGATDNAFDRHFASARQTKDNAA